MQQEPIVTIRRRDWLDQPCPECWDTALRVFTYNPDELICPNCNKVYPRWMTKGELISYLERDDETTVS